MSPSNKRLGTDARTNTLAFLQSADKWQSSSLTFITALVITAAVISGRISSLLDECERQPRDSRSAHTHTGTLNHRKLKFNNSAGL